MNAFYVFILLFLLPVSLRAQHEADNWYFGNKAGLTFKNGLPEILTDSKMVASEGTACISDPKTGKLLFYTEGKTVWNRNHKIMASGLRGHRSATQPATIIPFPGDSTRFYIFALGPNSYHPGSTSATDSLGLFYAIVDMLDNSDNTHSGGLSNFNKPLLDSMLLDSTAEKQCGTIHCNGKDYWLITHHYRLNIFYAFRITSEGIQPPVVSTTGTISSNINLNSGIGVLKCSPNGRWLAMVWGSSGTKVFSFDNSTGKVSDGFTLEESLKILHFSYGLSFSPDNSKLYLPYSGGGGTRKNGFMQYDLSSGDSLIIQSSGLIIKEVENGWGETPLQIAPDGKIYGAPTDNTNALWVIENPNVRGVACSVKQTQLKSLIQQSNSLPNFMDYMFNQGTSGLTCAVPRALLSAASVCAGSCTTFRDVSDTLRPRNTAWSWTFSGGKPSVSTKQNPVVCYDSAGTFDVLFIATNPNGSDTLRSSITIYPKPQATVLSDSLTICAGDSVALLASGGVSYLWSPAEGLSGTTSASVLAFPSKPTLYTVTAQNAFGCVSTASVFVNIGQLIAKTQDVRVCKGDTVSLSASGGTSYLWYPSDYLSDATTQNPRAFPPETKDYTVTVRSGNCVSTATMTVHVLPPPTLIVSKDTTICPGETVELFAEGAETYHWSPEAQVDLPNAQRVRTSPTVTTVYTVTGRNAAGCLTTATLKINVENRLEVSARSDGSICEGGSVRLYAEGNATEFEWSPAELVDDAKSQSPMAKPKSTTTFWLQARSGKCSQTTSVTVVVNPRPVLTISENQTICLGESVRLSVSGATEYAWTGESLDNPQSSNPTASPTKTTLYTVVGKSAFGCTSTASVLVNVRDSVGILLSVKDSTDAVPGEEVLIPIYAESSADFRADLRYEVRFDARLLYPTDYPNAVIEQGERVLTMTQKTEIRAGKTEINRLRFRALLSAGKRTPLKLRLLEKSGTACLSGAEKSGVFTISGYCFGFDLSGYTPLTAVIEPNPAVEEVRIKARCSEVGEYMLQVFDAYGREVWRENWDKTERVAEEKTFPMSGLGSGVYFVVIRSQAELTTAKFVKE